MPQKNIYKRLARNTMRAARLHGCTAARLYCVGVRRRAAAERCHRYRNVRHGHMRRRKTMQMLEEDDLHIFILRVYMFRGF